VLLGRPTTPSHGNPLYPQARPVTVHEMIDRTRAVARAHASANDFIDAIRMTTRIKSLWEV
jgi:hypothetical protein